ncbi:MAG: hypothetical protein ACI9U2_000413, partial [Bradymonadia bacterium]
ASAQLGVPDVMPYQGQLLQADGSPYTGAVDISVRLYERSDAQVPIWTEELQAVEVEDGKFYVYLGMTNPIVANVNDGQTRYLGIAVNGEPEATPRQTIGSVPFAIYARNAAYLGGQAADVFVTINDLDARSYVDEQRVIELINANGGGEGGLNEAAVNVLIDARNYVSGDAVEVAIDARNYPSEARVIELINEAAINNEGGLNADQVNALIDARNYLNEDGIRALIESYNYLNAAGVDALIDARDYVNADGVNVLIDARDYLDADAVNALIDARDYLNEAAIIALIDARIAANNVNIEAQIADLQNQINNVNNAGGGGATGYILGRSAQTSNGRFSFNNQNGTAAADAMCKATFAGEASAHLCTIMEVEQSLSTGDYNRNGDIDDTTTWTMGALIQGATFANSSKANNCYNFMYNSGDLARGQRMNVNLDEQSPGNGGGIVGRTFNVQRDIACNTNLPVMCCR